MGDSWLSGQWLVKALCSMGMRAAAPPSLTLPHKGGGDDASEAAALFLSPPP